MTMTSAFVSEAALTISGGVASDNVRHRSRLAESSRLRFKPFRDLPLSAGQLLDDAPMPRCR